MQSSEQRVLVARTLPRLPSRNQLPPGIIIENIPWLGTTWYERGPAYWLRRAGGTLLAAGLAALDTGIVWLFLTGVYHSSGRHAWFYGLLAFEIVFSIVTCTWLLTNLIRHPVTRPALLRGRQRPARQAATMGMLARSGSALAQLGLVLVAALTLGLWTAALIRSFVPVSPVERRARQELAEHLRAHAGNVDQV